jgi:hypothetical protein
LAGVANLDGTRLDACVAELEAQASSCDRALSNLMFGCRTAFQGTIPNGQACNVPGDESFAACADGYCDNGTCEPFVPSGGDCSAPGSTCDFGALETCVGGTTCGTQLGFGAQCSRSQDCLSRSCDVNGSGTCGVPTSDGLCGVISN